MGQVFSNFATTVLAAPITADSTEMQVLATTGGLFAALEVNEYEIVFITDGTYYEVVKVTSRLNDAMSIERGQESTPKRAWGAGSQVIAGMTKGGLANFWQKSDSMASFNVMNYQLFK